MKDIPAIARKIVKSILDDISDRRGIGDEFDSYDSEIKKEIKDEWRDRIIAILKKPEAS